MNKNRLYRALFVVGMIALSLLLIYFAFREIVPELIPLLKNGSEAEIEAFLSENSSIKGIICTALLQMVQVWSIFISGVPIQIAAGIVYGVAGGFAICMISSMLAHYAALMVWRQMGRKMQAWMPVNEGSENKLQKYLHKNTPPIFVVVLACLIPVMPNGVIPIMASKMDITPRSYVLAVFGGTAVNIVICCAVGKQLILGNWIGALVCVLLLFASVVLLWIFREPVLNQVDRIAAGAKAGHASVKNRLRSGK